MPSRITYPAIFFSDDGRFYFVNDAAWFDTGATLGLRLTDNAGAGWRVVAVLDPGWAPPTGWRALLGRRGLPLPLQVELAPCEPMPLARIKTAAGAAIDLHPDDWIDDEFFAGEAGPPRDEALLHIYLKERLHAAASLAAMSAIIEAPYAGATAFYDEHKMLPGAEYPAIAFTRSGRIVAYRSEALLRAPRSMMRSGDLVGLEVIDSAGRCWRVDRIARQYLRGSRLVRLFTRPPDDMVMYDIEVEITEGPAMDFANVCRRTHMAIGAFPESQRHALNARIGSAATVADLLDLFKLRDEGALTQQDDA